MLAPAALIKTLLLSSLPFSSQRMGCTQYYFGCYSHSVLPAAGLIAALISQFHSQLHFCFRSVYVQSVYMLGKPIQAPLSVCVYPCRASPMRPHCLSVYTHVGQAKRGAHCLSVCVHACWAKQLRPHRLSVHTHVGQAKSILNVCLCTHM